MTTPAIDTTGYSRIVYYVTTTKQTLETCGSFGDLLIEWSPDGATFAVGAVFECLECFAL